MTPSCCSSCSSAPRAARSASCRRSRPARAATTTRMASTRTASASAAAAGAVVVAGATGNVARKLDQRLVEDLIDAGSREHYADAALYDHEYRRRRADVTFYRELARKR